MKVGLTGSIGCGKSTVLRVFSDAGWKTLETDRVVADLLENNKAIIEQLRSRWGSRVFKHHDGSVDRKAVASIVFSKPEELKWLEQVLQPEVRLRWTKEIKAEPHANSLVEIPLLHEKSLESNFDTVVCIYCDNQVANCRLAEKGYSEEEISHRRTFQMPLENKALLSDYVLLNTGSIEFLKKQTLRLIKQLLPS